jgi:hypothetical protein
MKKCPYCAEDIQDAAIVCRHCGRELQGGHAGAVMVRAKPRRWGRVLLIIMAAVVGIPLALIAIGAVEDTLNPSWRNTHDGGACRLNATFTDVALSGTEHPGEFLIANRDRETWHDAQLSVYGEIISGPNKGTQAGVHRLTRDIGPGLTPIQLSDFQNKDGIRWVPSTMRAAGLGVTATLRTEKCELEHSFR